MTAASGAVCAWPQQPQRHEARPEEGIFAVAHYSNFAENVGSQTPPSPPQYFINTYGMSGDNAAAASRTSGYK